MPRQSLRRLLTVFVLLTMFVLGSGFAGVVLADDQQQAADGIKVDQAQLQADRIEIQLAGDKVEAGGVVVQLGESTNFTLGVLLELEDGQLEVQRVVPDSPAAKAGIKPEDVLLASGETPLKQVADLQKLVQSSGGKPLALKVRRDGKEITIEVKPERHPQVQTFTIGEGGTRTIVIGEGHEPGQANKEQLQLRLQQLTEQVSKQVQGERQRAEEARKPHEPARTPVVSGWQVLNTPHAASLGASHASIPDDLEVTIKKKGNQPVQIKVKHDVHTWSVNETELHKLPEPIRGHVARMLPGHATAVRMMPGASLPGASPNLPHMNSAKPGLTSGAIILHSASPNPAAPNPAPGSPTAGGGFGVYVPRALNVQSQPLAGATAVRSTSPETSGDLQQEVQQLKRQLHELREQVEALRKK